MIPSNAYYTGQSYEIMGSPLILNGIAYYNLPLSEAATGAGYVALNLQTGQQVFYQNTTMPAFGQIFC